MHGYFVMVSGLPGSGKSILSRRLAPALGLPLLDKDDILERLFELKGVGDVAWRQALSRESDAILEADAIALNGGVLVSHWRQPGMSPNSGTPTDWLSRLRGKVVNLHCECSVEVAAQRFVQRERHAGHLDSRKTFTEVVSGIHTIAGLERINIGPRVDVDTSQTPMLDLVIREVHKALKERAG